MSFCSPLKQLNAPARELKCLVTMSASLYSIAAFHVTSRRPYVGDKEQKHFSPLETRLHFHLNSPNYFNCIVLTARALTFFNILDGVDQATIQIRHHRMLPLACSQSFSLYSGWLMLGITCLRSGNLKGCAKGNFILFLLISWQLFNNCSS